MQRFKSLLKKSIKKILRVSGEHILYFRFATAILGVVFALGVLEIYSRVTYNWPHVPIECYQLDNLLNHSHVPNKECISSSSEWNVVYKMNSFGFRDKKRSLEKPPNTFRILMLGDSFTEGWGVAQNKTFSWLLESKLNSLNKGHFEVLNMGVASYSPILEYLQLKYIGLKFNPDLVVLNFDYTDFADDKAYEAYASYDRDRIPISVDPRIPYRFQLYVNAATSLNDTELLASGYFRNNRLVAFVVKHSAFAKKLILTFFQARLQEKLASFTDESFRLPDRNFSLISTMLGERNIPFVIILYPHRINLTTKDGAAYFLTLQKFGDDNGIKVLNLLPLFVAKNPNDLYFKYDIHGTEEFHQVMAEGIYDYLMNNNFIFARRTP